MHKEYLIESIFDKVLEDKEKHILNIKVEEILNTGVELSSKTFVEEELNNTADPEEISLDDKENEDDKEKEDEISFLEEEKKQESVEVEHRSIYKRLFSCFK
jgi:hypothetical protein